MAKILSEYTLAECLAFASEFIKPYDGESQDELAVTLSVHFADQVVKVRAFVDRHSFDALETGFVDATGDHVCLVDFESEIEDKACDWYQAEFRRMRAADDDGYDPDSDSAKAWREGDKK